jgi:hypothetical protein
MDQEKLTIFARVKLLSRKAGFDLDLARMMSDDAYAKQELERYARSGVAELAAIATQAMQKLAPPETAAAPEPPVSVAASPAPVPSVTDTTAVETAAEQKKYVMGVRG